MKRQKKVKLFAVVDTASFNFTQQTTVDDVFSSALTVVSDKKDAMEFIALHEWLNNFEHYSAWCTLRERNILDINNWKEYKVYNTPIGNVEYGIVYLKVGLRDIAAAIRLQYGMEPVGASYESETERAYIEKLLKEKSEDAGE